MGNQEYWGWIPTHSSQLWVGKKLFDEVTDEDFKSLFKEEQILLSDETWDWLLDKLHITGKHIISYTDIKIDRCNECQEKILSLKIEIKNYEEDRLVFADVGIHENGLVRISNLKIPDNVLKKSANDINKYRDYGNIVLERIKEKFHRHVHHSSDAVLPCVQSDNEDSAKIEIMKEYVRKFFKYEEKISETALVYMVEDLYRALGELGYAKVALGIFSSAIPANKNKMFEESFKSFEESFNVLKERASNRQSLKNQYAQLLLTTVIIILWLISIFLDHKEMFLTYLFIPPLILLFYFGFKIAKIAEIIKLVKSFLIKLKVVFNKITSKLR